MKFAIITTKYGNGLKKDYKIIRDCLKPFYRISRHYIENPFKQLQNEVRIFLEVVDERYMGEHNILIPNQEWFEKKWIPLLDKFDLILTKSHYASDIFKKLHPNVKYIGFTSIDFYQSVTKKIQFFHSQGKSRAKNTRLILDAWLPHYPMLICISRDHAPFKPQANILHIGRHVQNQRYIQLLNESLIVLCPSDSEGFGHYINEARACQSVVLTTNGPPMNEFKNALLFKVTEVIAQDETLDEFWNINIRSFRQAIRGVLNFSAEDLIDLGIDNRKCFLSEKKKFEAKFVLTIKNYLNRIHL